MGGGLSLHKKIRNGLILAATLAAGSSICFGDGVISVNTTCVSATCTPGTLAAGQSDSGSFNTDIIVNGDTFNILGNWLDTLSADGTIPQENLNVRATLLSTAGSGGSSKDDLTIIDLLDKFAWPFSSSGFFENGTFSFGSPGTLSSLSFAESRLTVDNTQMPLLGAFSPFLTQTGSASATISTPDDPLPMQLEDLFSFGAGSQPGAFIQEGFTPVPEPGYAIPIVAALLGLVMLRRHRIGSRNDRSQVL